jgi:hypothetical protein
MTTEQQERLSERVERVHAKNRSAIQAAERRSTRLERAAERSVRVVERAARRLRTGV